MINDVITGISDALYDEFGDGYEVHTESSMQDMEEPAFFIYLTIPDICKQLTRRRKSELLFIIQFFPESTEPKKEINTVYERLVNCLELITVQNKSIRGAVECKDISDGILTATVKYVMFLNDEQKEIYMEELEMKQEVTNGRDSEENN